MDRLSIIILVVLLGLVAVTWTVSSRAASFAVAESESESPPVTVSDEVVKITVLDGETPSAIGQKLERAGVVRSAEHFAVLVGLMGMQNQLAAGEVELSKGLPTTVVIDRLRPKPTLPQFALTTIEGWRWEQVREHLEKKGVVSAADFDAAFAATDYNAPFLAGRPKDANLEGYLFPDTYLFFEKKTTAHDIVAKMLATFAEKFPPELQQKAVAQVPGWTLHQVVTLAAIVEREAQVASERPIIASVYLNRVRQGMPLQADPTTQYALSSNPRNVQQFGWWKRDLTEEDLQFNNPYNTYVVKGLPPGPICNPGADTLKAVAEPAQTKFLFFVAKNDGSHAFAETYEEHLRNVAIYQR